MSERILAWLIALGLRLLTGVRADWVGSAPSDRQRIYCVNHTSHLDFLLLWTALPSRLRRLTRPVAAADYWTAGRFRRFLILRIFRAVLVDRSGASASPLEEVNGALGRGESLIYFPEGTRGPGNGLLALKAGIYYLAKEWPQVELVPVWIDNAFRVLPKGSWIPIPLLCSARFGRPLRLRDGESRDPFLLRLQNAMLELQASR